jgi:hypothetical protein
MIYRDISDLSYRELAQKCSDTETSMDLESISNWLVDQISIRVMKIDEESETTKKACFLALLFIEFAKEPGKGICS